MTKPSSNSRRLWRRLVEKASSQSREDFGSSTGERGYSIVCTTIVPSVSSDSECSGVLIFQTSVPAVSVQKCNCLAPSTNRELFPPRLEPHFPRLNGRHNRCTSGLDSFEPNRLLPTAASVMNSVDHDCHWGKPGRFVDDRPAHALELLGYQLSTSNL